MSAGWVQVDLSQLPEADPGSELPGSFLNHPHQGPGNGEGGPGSAPRWVTSSCLQETGPHFLLKL